MVEPGMAVHSCNPSYMGVWGRMQEGHKFEANVNNLARPCDKINDKKKKK